MYFNPIKSATYNLMDDLDKGLKDKETIMLGGGNPAILDSTKEFFLPILTKMITRPNFFTQGIQTYSHPQGINSLLEKLSNYFNQKNNWNINSQNICITQGSQQGFYMLFNYLIGKYSKSKSKVKVEDPRLVLLKTPEYIGYYELVSKDFFISNPAISHDSGEQTFYYQIDFENLEKKLLEIPSIVAMIISTPNNPSSHTLSQNEVDKIIFLSKKYNKLVIFDHAYGHPFPGIVYAPSPQYPMNDRTVHFFSFSKLGLPGIRSGIMIANPSLIHNMTILNGILNLSPSSLTCHFLEEVLNHPFDEYLSKDLKPFYQKKMELASSIFFEELKGYPAKIHDPQGGFFLWLHARDLKKDSQTVYKILKAEKVIVVPGDYFFIDANNINEVFFRISFTQTDEKLVKGLKIIGKCLRKLYQL